MPMNYSPAIMAHHHDRRLGYLDVLAQMEQDDAEDDLLLAQLLLRQRRKID